MPSPINILEDENDERPPRPRKRNRGAIRTVAKDVVVPDAFLYETGSNVDEMLQAFVERGLSEDQGIRLIFKLANDKAQEKARGVYKTCLERKMNAVDTTAHLAAYVPFREYVADKRIDAIKSTWADLSKEERVALLKELSS